MRDNMSERLVIAEDTTERNLGKRKHTCRICNASGMFESYLVREMFQGTRDEFEYFECDNCKCLQISQVPENLGDYYGTEYYSFEKKEDMNRQYSTPVVNKNKILDVGCGSGAWLVSMADRGAGNLWGCDPYLEHDIHYGDRVKIRSCTIHDMDGDGTFDLIQMRDSFEHVTDPLEVLKSAGRLLKDDGILDMTIPVYPNIAFELFASHWFQIDAPRHITLHSEKSLSYLAERAGLKIEYMKYNSDIAQFVISFFYQHNVTYDEVTNDLILQFFTKDDIDMFRSVVDENNKNHYGDHMEVLMYKNNIPS